MIPSPFTAELARQHRAALAAARPATSARTPRRARLRAAAEVRRLLAAAPAPSGPAACPTC